MAKTTTKAKKTVESAKSDDPCDLLFGSLVPLEIKLPMEAWDRTCLNTYFTAMAASLKDEKDPLMRAYLTREMAKTNIALMAGEKKGS